MIQWLLDGSALLVGSALLNPTTGAWTPLPIGAQAMVAVGTQGRIATLDLGDGSAPTVRILSAGGATPPVALPTGLDGSWALELVGDEVYVHNSSPETGEARCWSVAQGAATALPSCLEASFAAIDSITPAGTSGVILTSQGEGHPGVDLLRSTGSGLEAVPLPWVDLYPFGPLALLPRTDGSFDILTPCVLGPDRPCLGKDGDGAEGPARWYRWSPGAKPKLMAKGKKAEVLPDPSSDRVVTLRGEQVCISGPGQKTGCFTPPPSAAAERITLTLDTRHLSWDDAAGTVTFSPDSDRMAAEYTSYVMRAAELEAALGGRPQGDVEVVLELVSREQHTYTPEDPNLPSPMGGFLITTIQARVVGRP